MNEKESTQEILLNRNNQYFGHEYHMFSPSFHDLFIHSRQLDEMGNYGSDLFIYYRGDSRESIKQIY